MKKYSSIYKSYQSIHYVIFIGILWALADAVIAFYLPIRIHTATGSYIVLGLLFAFGSMVGGVSDLTLGYFSNKIRYTQYLLFGLLITICVIYFSLFSFSLGLMFLIVSLRGVYNEFIQIGIFNYITRHKNFDEHSKNFGLVNLFQNLSYIVGPILAGILLLKGQLPIYITSAFLCLVAIFVLKPLADLHIKKEKPFLVYQNVSKFEIHKESKVLKKVWHVAFISLIGILMYDIWESFMWTLIPLESSFLSPALAGLLTATFIFPLATLEGYAGEIADKFGRKFVFICGFLLAGICTYLFGLQNVFAFKIVFSLLASCGFAFAYPAILGENSNKLRHNKKYIGHFAGVQRIFVNIGYVLGPVFAGIFSSIYGIQQAFSILGIIMILSFFVILIFMVHFTMKGRIHKRLLVEFDF